MCSNGNTRLKDMCQNTTVNNTTPSPCQHLFGLFTLHPLVFFLIFECLADTQADSLRQQEGRSCDYAMTAPHTWMETEVVLLAESSGITVSSPPLLRLLKQIKCSTFCSTSVHLGCESHQPPLQSYVVLRLGPPGLLTDFCRVLAR